MDYEQSTKDELKEELARRDLQVSGTKDELIERLTEDDDSKDREPSEDGDASDGTDKRSGRGRDDTQDARSGGGRDLAEILVQATRRFSRLTNLQVEAISRVEAVNGATEVGFEVVELERIPRATDVLASYSVDVDGEGNILGWRREHRYLRSQQDV